MSSPQKEEKNCLLGVFPIISPTLLCYHAWVWEKKRLLVFPIISNQSTFGQADNKHMIDESEHMAFEIIYVKVLSFLIIIKL